MVGAPLTKEQWLARFGDARLPQTQPEWTERTRAICGDDVPTVSDADS